MNEWTSAAHAASYLERIERPDGVPQLRTGYAALLEEVPRSIARVLDLGSGDGRLLEMVLRDHSDARAVAIDVSPFMLERLRERFGATPAVQIVDHDLERPLPALGTFDLVISSLAIHHVDHDRKRRLYEEVWAMLEPGGVFCNLEHVASASEYGHARFLDAIGVAPADEDPSNKLLDVHTQLVWLREIGFDDVDCYWKWRELALLAGRKRGTVGLP